MKHNKPKRNKKRTLVMIVSAVLIIVIGVSTTFAWTVARDQKINSYKNSGFDAGKSVVISEDKDKNLEDELKLGELAKKEVSVINAGATPVLVRVAFEEALRTLDNGGIGYKSTTAGARPSAPAGAGIVWLPQRLDGKAISNNTATWAQITNISSTASPVVSTANLNIYVPASGGDSIVAWYEYTAAAADAIDGIIKDGDAIYQVVNLPKVKLGRAAGVTTGAYTTIDILEPVEYLWYTVKEDQFTTWNKKTNVFTHHGGDFTSDNGFTYTDNITYASIPFPTDPAKSNFAGAIADIDLLYNSTDLVTTLPTPAVDGVDKWYYNSVDGYFYYLGALASASSTAKILEGFKVNGDGSDAFAVWNYDLAVTVEAIQATKAAIETGTQVDTTAWLVDSAMQTYLQGICAA